jgi:hypothetical protein
LYMCDIGGRSNVSLAAVEHNPGPQDWTDRSISYSKGTQGHTATHLEFKFQQRSQPIGSEDGGRRSAREAGTPPFTASTHYLYGDYLYYLYIIGIVGNTYVRSHEVDTWEVQKCVLRDILRSPNSLSFNG